MFTAHNLRLTVYAFLGLSVLFCQAPKILHGQDLPTENSIGMKFARIPAGKSQIGVEGKEGEINFNPLRTIEIKTEFYLSVYEVRVSDFIKVTGINPSESVNTAAESPVLWVSWDWSARQKLVQML